VLLGDAVDNFERIGILLAVVIFGAIGTYTGYKSQKDWQSKKNENPGQDRT
jgi:hypothetical protein